MATVKKPSKKPSKSRAATYEPKVKFNGSFEDMVKISTTGAGSNKKNRITGTKD